MLKGGGKTLIPGVALTLALSGCGHSVEASKSPEALNSWFASQEVSDLRQGDMQPIRTVDDHGFIRSQQIEPDVYDHRELFYGNFSDDVLVIALQGVKHIYHRDNLDGAQRRCAYISVGHNNQSDVTGIEYESVEAVTDSVFPEGVVGALGRQVIQFCNYGPENVRIAFVAHEAQE